MLIDNYNLVTFDLPNLQIYMTDFENYLYHLALHEEEKSQLLTIDPREKILINAGIRLNWMGDYLANPNIVWSELTKINVNDIQFTGTNHKWNQILIQQCDRSPARFHELITQNPQIKEMFHVESSYNPDLPILVRKSEDAGKYKVFDGMHRFVGALINGQSTIMVYFPKNEEEILPWCENHVVYDLIRGFMRNANDSDGELQLLYALKLLLRTYGNVREYLVLLLAQEVGITKPTQKIIQKALGEIAE
jgi:hypothetical protein